MQLLIQAEIDGELDAARAAVLATHFADCSDCAAARTRLAALSADLRRTVPYHTAPASLRAALERQIGAARSPAPSAGFRPGWWQVVVARWRELAAFGTGAAIAAAAALAILAPGGTDLAESVVSSHIRALQPGHLMDVASTDQHTVKPWFAGRADFSPPVKDLAAHGFPLVGGRLDYVDGHLAAALVYFRAKHPIDLLIWPADADRSPTHGARSGYNYIRWAQDGMVFWAISDLNAKELADFVRLWRAA